MTEDRKFIGLTQRKMTDVNLIEIRLAKVSQSAMVNSGAQISCVAEEIFRKCGLSEQFELQKPD